MNQSDELLKRQVILSLLPGIGPVSARNLVAYCGGVEDIFTKSKFQLEKIPGIGSERAGWIADHHLDEQAEEEVYFIRKHRIIPIFYLDEEYPFRLKNCIDAPTLLFFKGSCNLNAKRILAIVGTRHITTSGREVTEKLIADLQRYEVLIVSGLAYGVDILAHKEAVKHQLPTVAVTAHGLDRIYPFIHKSTAEKIILNGGILTEYTSGTNPDRQHFPARNRIVAGMSDAVIVVESAVKGGALITAELANDYNRDVFAIPGRVTDTFSQGCHQLIRQNKAMLVENAEQIAQALNWDLEEEARRKRPEKQLAMFRELKEEEKIIVRVLQENGSMEIDLLAIRAMIPVSKVSSTLLNLEFAGLIRSLPGKVYELI